MARTNGFDAAKDPVSHAAIYKGVTKTQLAAIFDVSDKKVEMVLGELTPVGTGPRGSPIYKISEAAPLLALPKITPEQIAEQIKGMHFTDLPMILRKEFWAGQKLKQDYEIKAGDLWPTTKVIESVGEFFKLVKMSAQLMSDAVERQTELTDRQRAIIKQLTDSMLEDLRSRTVEVFSQKPSKSEADEDGL
jgi:hypothetical protein